MYGAVIEMRDHNNRRIADVNSQLKGDGSGIRDMVCGQIFGQTSSVANWLY